MFAWKGVLLCVLVSIIVSESVNIQELLDQLTPEERCGQMTQVTFDVIQKDPSTYKIDDNPVDINKLRVAILDNKVGSILNAPYTRAQKKKVWQEIIRVIQDVALNESRSKVPILYGIDSIHGANYIQEGVLFPQPLSLGATFNKTLVEKIGAVTALETRAVGIPWNFNPVLDVGRHPAWPRVYETFGEDVHVTIALGVAYVKGHQGHDLKSRTKAATCLKHFIGYSYPFNGQDRTVAWIPENLLRETFLPPFEAAIEAGSLTVMLNSADVNGLPGHANYHYLTNILKRELNFTGFTVSDWEDVIRLHTRDRLAETPEEAVRLAVMSGVDMSMVPYDFSFYNHCVNIWKKGDLDFQTRVNDAVLRILRVKETVGLFENSYPFNEDLANVATQESENLNAAAARESLILAQNDGVLPLKANQKILVTGPTANLLKVLNGGWSYTWQGEREELFQEYANGKLTILEALQQKSDSVTYHQGSGFDKLASDFEETLKAAQNSDLIVLCIGETTYTEAVGNVEDLHIDNAQYELADALYALNKPVVVVYVGGRPRVITRIVERANAVVVGFLPGNEGAPAIADLLFGEFNPSGKMPLSYPRAPNSVLAYDYKGLENFGYTFNAKFVNTYNPLYRFGHGLSYTTYEYSDLKLKNNVIHEDESVYGSVTVRNTGNREGQESVLVYLNDDYAQISRPTKQLKFFTKINLKPNESKVVNFELTPYDLSFINIQNNRIVEAGRFFVYVDKLSASFRLE